MRLVGYNFTKNANGGKNMTLQTTDNYNAYYSDAEAGRGCMGVKVESIYVGDIDCSALKIGMDIDILYLKLLQQQKAHFSQSRELIFLSNF